MNPSVYTRQETRLEYFQYEQKGRAFISGFQISDRLFQMDLNFVNFNCQHYDFCQSKTLIRGVNSFLMWGGLLFCQKVEGQLPLPPAPPPFTDASADRKMNDEINRKLYKVFGFLTKTCGDKS